LDSSNENMTAWIGNRWLRIGSNSSCCKYGKKS